MNLLFLTFLAPLLGFLILAFARGRISENAAAVVGVGSVGISALTTAIVGWDFLHHMPEGGAYTQHLWQWMSVGQFTPSFALRLDALSLTMLGVITGVGFFIHLFASWYMRGDEGYGRFFSYMNLFVASMLFLVLGDNLLFLYFGWEGVGLASYLLIGFWYQDPANGAAARKAFVITRVGDTFMAIGLFILYREFGTLNIQELATLAPAAWPVVNGVGATGATVVALLLLGGAVGKSAQLPLQTWLPDAMAGPTPVSALIHAATMVTAGVYLIARTHALFELSPFALQCVGAIGAITLLMAGFIALMQTDIKKILAYSTMSQIGYMFLAEGVGAYQPAVFHLMTHAFFKALLFLSSGSVILAMHHEQDIFKMGGLRKHIPFVFACMLIGTLALTAFPFTSGFYSKDEILHQAYLTGHHELWLAGLFGAFLTSVYSFRLIFITFFGPERWRSQPATHGHDEHHGLGPKDDPHGAHTLDHHIPLGVLLLLAIVGGFIHLPLGSVLPEAHIPEGDHGPAWIAYLPVLVSLLGILVSWFLFLKKPGIPAALKNGALTKYIGQFWKSAFGFDWLYDRLFVRPFVWAANINKNDIVDWFIGLIPASLTGANGLLALTQNGKLRWYALVAGAGACALLAAVALH
ncbi:NADH-quinone oxidoreductase subunit L [Stagnimonas aquatica]|uniref:NADH-quinone oxidoreductase subunit L n=1 Tax=Stagnimonas aquatica TaxID=2689987 RepID=A0A3N0V8Y4_9GAMM|nr:NADH-quinone oxidoreductase subunit L [Stagnimonas aquatica]ROH89092.1 NADH-quinone oxidoreductase subunit L [Stagnimonas aquatica]